MVAEGSSCDRDCMWASKSEIFTSWLFTEKVYQLLENWGVGTCRTPGAAEETSIKDKNSGFQGTAEIAGILAPQISAFVPPMQVSACKPVQVSCLQTEKPAVAKGLSFSSIFQLY